MNTCYVVASTILRKRKCVVEYGFSSYIVACRVRVYDWVATCAGVYVGHNCVSFNVCHEWKFTYLLFTLAGSIPESLGNLLNLEQLYLSKNQLSTCRDYVCACVLNVCWLDCLSAGLICVLLCKSLAWPLKSVVECVFWMFCASSLPVLVCVFSCVGGVFSACVWYVLYLVVCAYCVMYSMYEWVL